MAAEQALVNADRIVLRTRIHPGLSAFDGDPRVSDCDDLYASLPSFDEVYAAIADRVIAIATEVHGHVVYAVPGNPWFGERTVPLVLERAEAMGLASSVLAGVSFLDIVAASAETRWPRPGNCSMGHR